MTPPNQIYKKWLNEYKDHRFLRRKRWAVLDEIITKYNVKSVLEFGSGISTVLFDNLGIKVNSFETDLDHAYRVKQLVSDNIRINVWDNKEAPTLKTYDLALIDGAEPRHNQIKLGIKHARFLAIDDYNGSKPKRYRQHLEGFERIDDQTTIMAVFDTNG